MDPISNVDRLVLVLRQKLEERSRTFSKTTHSAARSGRENVKSGIENVQALAALQGVDDRQVKRALIQSVLSDSFGANLINDAKFQQIVGRVVEALDDEPTTANLMNRIVSEMRAEAAKQV